MDGIHLHLIAEKALKAAMARTTDEIPKIHHLLKLANMANVNDDLSESQKNLLGKLMPLQIEARYPEHKAKIAATLTNNYCADLLKETEEFLCWIKARLEK
ncbi:MAG: HEPN domain-containing protein [Defluviitaleaceae bacterium]|nr:HEPN domain-containing protein [Defluviitaleaceae bacterium]